MAHRRFVQIRAENSVLFQQLRKVMEDTESTPEDTPSEDAPFDQVKAQLEKDADREENQVPPDMTSTENPTEPVTPAGTTPLDEGAAPAEIPSEDSSTEENGDNETTPEETA